MSLKGTTHDSLSDIRKKQLSVRCNVNAAPEEMVLALFHITLFDDIIPKTKNDK